MVLDLSYFSIPVAVKWCHCQIVATCRHQHAEGGLLGYARSPHPEILLKIAIAWNDGGPTIGWVAGLYTNEAFGFLKSIHEKIAASTLAECDAQDFYGAFRKQAGAAYLSLPPALYFVAFCFNQPPATLQLSFDEQLASTLFDATVANLEACYYATARSSTDLKIVLAGC